MALRDVTDDDLPIFFQHQQDPEASRMAAFPGREWDAFMAHWRTKVLATASNEVRTIVVDGEVTGNILSWEGGGKRLIGYWLGREHWGKGVATAAVAEFLADREGCGGASRAVSEQSRVGWPSRWCSVSTN